MKRWFAGFLAVILLITGCAAAAEEVPGAEAGDHQESAAPAGGSASGTLAEDLKLVQILLEDEDFRNRQRMGKTCRRVRRTPANAASTLSSRVAFPYRKGKRRDLPALSARTTPRRRFGTPTNADILT